LPPEGKETTPTVALPPRPAPLRSPEREGGRQGAKHSTRFPFSLQPLSSPSHLSVFLFLPRAAPSSPFPAAAEREAVLARGRPAAGRGVLRSAPPAPLVRPSRHLLSPRPPPPPPPPTFLAVTSEIFSGGFPRRGSVVGAGAGFAAAAFRFMEGFLLSLNPFRFKPLWPARTAPKSL
jgi:hypothetical protein